MENVTTDKLMADLRAVVRDAEELLQATAGQGSAQLKELRARAEESLGAARARLQEAGDDARKAARDIDEQVRANPWAAVGVAAADGDCAWAAGREAAVAGAASAAACAISSNVCHGSGGFGGCFNARPTSSSTSGVDRVS